MVAVRFFAYGTAQKGLFHHEQLSLGEPVARLRLAHAHSLVVLRYLACSDPECSYLHRMAVLVHGRENHHPEGDVYEIDDAMLARLDALAAVLGPFTRVEEELSDGSTAFTYRQVPPDAIHHAVEGLADIVEDYPRDEPPQLKDCCAAELGHYGPHDVVRALDALRYREARLRNLIRHFDGDLHMLEATAATTPYPVKLAVHVLSAVSEHRDDREALRARLAELLEAFPPRF
jgi:gamma-glutamylcyclotransferase (GGCT)/AIG2-like uncharacterized protein YtfP